VQALAGCGANSIVVSTVAPGDGVGAAPINVFAQRTGDELDAQRVRRAVASLPEEHRLVVELRFFAGATLDEIAAALGCPLGTVKSRLHFALEKLRQMSLAVNLFTSSGDTRESRQ